LLFFMPGWEAMVFELDVNCFHFTLIQATSSI
jgi:hypothetical protein